MKGIYKVLILAVLTLFCQAVHAQRSVSGTVKDTKETPLVGAAVLIAGTSTSGTVTDIDGNWTLTIPKEYQGTVTLEVSCLGFKTQTVEYKGQQKIDIALEESSQMLDETIVVGYGAMRRSDLTGSLTSIRINEDDAAQSTSLDQLLQGKAAGVQVLNSSAAPDAGINIRVRGMTSLTGSSEPLYVIDGIILTTSDTNLLSSDMTEEVNSLAGLNPQDIASIEILKDASATAIYGTDGANGVVLITTKTSNKEKPSIRFSAGIDYITQNMRQPVLTFDEYADYVRDNTKNDGREQVLNKLYENPDDPSTLKVTPVDWQDYSLSNSFRQRYYFSISGRPDTIGYSFSLGYNSQDGIVRNTGMDSYTIRLNVEKTIAGIVKVGTKTNLSYVRSRAMQGANTSDVARPSSSMMRSILTSRPYTTSSLDDDGYDDTDWDEAEEDSKSTPDKWIKDAYNKREQFRVTPNIYVEAKLLPWLTYKLTTGCDYHMAERTSWKGPRVVRTTTGAQASISDNETIRWNVDNLLMFNQKWGGHGLSGTLGMTIGSRQSDTHSIYGYNIRQSDLKSDSINSAPNTTFAYVETKVNNISYFLRVIYNYKDRYVVTATGRADGSCKFKDGNVYSFFPSFAGAWRINQERWFNVPVISSLKLRLGWGEVGNSAVSSYQTFVTYNNNKYPTHASSNQAGYVVGIYPANIANENLKWETTRQWNLGLDIGLWRGRLAMTIDLYDKHTRDLLNLKSLPLSSGFQNIWVNQGSILNRGLELSIETTPVKKKRWEWNLSANISFNRNRITDIGTDSDGKTIFLNDKSPQTVNYYLGNAISNGRYFSDPANIFVEGQPIGLFYGYKTDGIIGEGQTGPGFSQGATVGEGHIRYCDLNRNGHIDSEDRTIIGDPNPDFLFGFSTSLKYRKLTFSIAFNGSYGNDICNANLNQSWDTSNSNLMNIRREAYVNAWSKENPGGTMPALGAYSMTETKLFSDRVIEDGSYLRLSNIQLSYTFNIKNTFIRSIGVGAAVNNAYVWTRYSGWDPEVNSFGSDMTRIGIDFGSYPGARTYCLDVKFTF